MDFVFFALLPACAITALFASLGFNRPSWARSYTTAARYHLAILGHIVLYLHVLLALYGVVWLGFAMYAKADASITKPSASGLLWIALVLTLCVRALSALSYRTRAWLQRIAGIPSYARRIATVLAAAEFKPAPSVSAEARETLLSRGIDAEGDWLPLAQPTHNLLFNATALFIQLRHWEQDPRFGRFVNEVKNDLDSLRGRFDDLAIRVARTTAAIERLGEIGHLCSKEGAAGASVESEQLDGLLRKSVSDLIANEHDDIAAFYDDACLMATRGALATQWTGYRRDHLLAHLGFAFKHRARPATSGILAYTAALVYFGLWLLFLIMPSRFPVDIKRGLLVSVVALIMFGSMAIAIVPKLRWGFANSGLREKTPVGFVVGAGVCALLFSVAVNLVVGVLIGGWEGAVVRLRTALPYLPAAALIAVTTAWLVQDHRWRGTLWPRMRRLRDAATLGSVWVVVVMVGGLLRAEIFSEAIDPKTLLGGAVGGLTLGAVLGYAIPESVRVDDMRSARFKTLRAPGDLASPTARQATS